MLTDKGIEGGEGLELLEGLLEVWGVGGVCHEGVYSFFELIGQWVVWGEDVVLEILGVDGETLVGESVGSVLGGFLFGELGLGFEELGDEEVVIFHFVIFYDHGTFYLGEAPPPFDVFVGYAFAS